MIKRDDFLLEAAVLTDIGCTRENNDDYAQFGKFYYKDMQSCLYLSVLADGVGGNNGGLIAARTSVESIFSSFNVRGKNILNQLISSYSKANRIVFNLNSKISSSKNMASTCVSAVIFNSDLYWANVGDSRLYIRSKNVFRQISSDHSLVNELYREGKIKSSEIPSHPQKNIITRALGIKDSLKVDSGLIKGIFNVGDKLLLCSDGLYNYVTDEEMDLFLDLKDVYYCAKMLIELAKHRGGRDNISVIILSKVIISS